MDIKTLFEKKDYNALRQALTENPALANEGVSLCGDGTRKAHPLHRICDAVFAKKITDEDAVEIAKILLEFGANIDGDKLKGASQTPLIAAASLHAEKLAIFYIDNGADVYCTNTGGDSETALHWAAYCGRDKLTARLIAAKADINQRDTSFNGTPLDWAIHVLKDGNRDNTYHQLDCVKLLLQAGADVSLLDKSNVDYLNSIVEGNEELKALLR